MRYPALFATAAIAVAAARRVLPARHARHLHLIALCPHRHVVASLAVRDPDDASEDLRVVEECVRCPARRVHNLTTGSQSPWTRIVHDYARA